MYYDELRRMKRLENADGTTTWSYDNGPNALGRLTQTVSPTGQQTDYAYEPKASANRGLLQSVTSSLLAPDATASTTPTQLTTTYHYDQYSRLEQADYPGSSSFGVKYGFDAGTVASVSNAADASQVYWQVTGTYQGYRVNEETFGNGLTTERQFDDRNGHLNSIATKNQAAVLQSLGYEYELNGNLHTRTAASGGVTETFGYDALNRVTSTAYSNQANPEAVVYDPLTNGIARKEPIGDYVYQSQGRDWIKTAGSTQYTPDQFGNVWTRSGPDVPGGLQEFTYTTFNLPSHVSLSNGATSRVDFAYDAGGVRVVKQTSNETTYYAGDLYQRTVSASGTAQRFMIYSGDRAVAVVTQATAAGPLQVEYLHDDSLGSVETITASDQSVVSTRHFDAFGDSRGPIASVSQEPYGYTGQEEDAELGLVNMHGRLYDPQLGQFLSPDPEIQQPYGQGLNRFAYVLNRPLNLTDPSGFNTEEWETDSVSGCRTSAVWWRPWCQWAAGRRRRARRQRSHRDRGPRGDCAGCGSRGRWGGSRRFNRGRAKRHWLWH